MSMVNTYMYGDYSYPLEQKEWTRMWLDEATDMETPRVLLVGDSIFNGVSSRIIDMTDGTVLFDCFVSSKAVDNPYFMEELGVFMKQEGKRKIIVFNNGLHGWHLDDETQYAEGYENIILHLKETYPDAIVVVSLTTFIKDERHDRVLVRNEVAKRIAEKHQCPIMDMYSESKKHEEQLIVDGIHFTEQGYIELCKFIMNYVKEF